MKKKDIDNIMDNNFYIIIDTREKANQHIIKAFEDYNIKHIKRKLNYGDYGVLIAKDDNLINEDIVLKVSVERKGSLDEIGANLTRGKERFAREMQRCVDDNASMIIMVEGVSYEDIINENYKIKLTAKQFLALLHTIYGDYKVPTVFIPNKNNVPLYIYDTLKYWTRSFLKNNN